MNIIWKGERRMCPALRLCDHLLSAARREEDPCARAGRFLLVNEGPHPDMGHGRTRPRVLVKGGGMHFFHSRYQSHRTFRHHTYGQAYGHSFVS